MKCFSCCKLTWLCIFCLSILAISCSKEQSTLTSYGIKKELADYRSSNINSISYELNFTVSEDLEDSVSASETILFDFRTDPEDFILDFDAPLGSIYFLKVNGTEADIVLENNHLVIDASLLKKANNSININFTAGEQSLNRNEEYLYTLFVPARASSCFPVIDQPDIKASYSLSLNLPKDWVAISNSEVEEEIVEGSVRRYDFKPTPPISSYLFAFAAGKFEIIEKETAYGNMRMFHRESDSIRLNNSIDEIFDWHIKSLDWLEDYTSIKYPFSKFDFALIPSFQYGGMEHPGAVFYKASSLLLDENPTINQEIGRGRLIAHESAHMWFGDLVTMTWFDDVWLKEVFANFMASKIINPSFQEIDHDLKFILGHYPAAYSVDRTNGTHAIAQSLDDLYNAGSLYGSIIYQKAPIIMRKLEQQIGKIELRDGLRKYLNEYSFGNATWSDLIKILSEESGKNLRRWNKSWVETAGMPIMVVNVRDKNDEIDRLSLYQVNGEAGVWPQNYSLEIGNDSIAISREVEFNDRVFNIKDDSLILPTYVFPNTQGEAYGYFKLGTGTKAHYFKDVSNIESSTFRAAVWMSLYENMLNRNSGPASFLDALIAALPVEDNPLIINYLHDCLETIYWKLLSKSQQEEYSAKIEGVLFNQVVGATNPGIRSSFFKTFYSIATTKEGLKILEEIWSGTVEMEDLSLSENDMINLAYQLSLKSEDDSFLQQQIDRVSNVDRKAKMNFVKPALSSNKQVRDQFFESLMNEKNRQNEDWVLTSLTYLNHPLRQSSSVEYLAPSLEILQEIKASGDIFFPKRWLDKVFYGHNSVEAADIVRQFLYKNHNYPKDLKNKILQSTDLLFRAESIFEENADSD